LLRRKSSEQKPSAFDAADASRVSHHNAAFLLRILVSKMRVSKMRASARSLKSFSFLVLGHEESVLRIKLDAGSLLSIHTRRPILIL
jgi:hypothetical protein